MGKLVIPGNQKDPGEGVGELAVENLALTVRKEGWSKLEKQTKKKSANYAALTGTRRSDT